MTKKNYRSFTDARKFVHKLKLKNKDEWQKYYRSGNLPIDIPKCPWSPYKKDWRGFGDWLGTGVIASFNMQFRPFEEARKFARKLGLKDGNEWNQYCKSGKKPDDIPKTPRHVYKKEWRGMGDFLGTGFVYAKYRKFRSFKDARKFVRSLKLKDQTEWHKYSKSDKKPEDIPANPRRHYQKEWVSMGDWLGTGYIANQNRKYISYNDAKKIVHKLKLKNKDEWVEYSKSGKKPDDIPANPPSPYKKEWKGWGDFLGTGRIANQVKSKNWQSAKEARIAIRKIAKEVFGGKPFTPQDWYKAHDAGKIPKNLPKYLHDIYRPDSQRNRKRSKKK